MAEEGKILRVITSEFLPPVENRNNNTVYFVYDKMALYLGKSFYSDPFCIVEELPDTPVEGMLYITTTGLLESYINYNWYYFGSCQSEEEIELLTKAGSIYFMRAEYRYLDLQTKSIALPYQNGTYQLSVNLAKCLQIDKDTVIYYNEETGQFEIEGNHNDTELHVNHKYEGIETAGIKTTIEGNRIYSDIKIVDNDTNIIKLLENGLYANASQYASKEEFDRLVQLYYNYKVTLESMITELHDEMEDKGYNTTTEMIAEKIAEALEEYEPTIQSLLENYDLIYTQLGYIRDLAISYSDEKVQEVKTQIIDYLDQIREAWDTFDRDSDHTIEDEMYSPEEQEYLANAVQKAVNDIKLRRKNTEPVGTTVPVAYMFIGKVNNSIPATKQITPPALNVISQKSRFIGYTNIVIVDPKVNPLDEYYYAFSSEAPTWNEDVIAAGRYKRLINQDIEAEDNTPIIIVEVNSDKRAIKYSLVMADVRSEEYIGMPILNIEAREGSESYKMILDIDPPLSEGNMYAYSVSTTMPETNELVPENYHIWDGTGEIDLTNNPESLITLIECDATTYMSYKVGTFRAYAQDILRRINVTTYFGTDPGTTKIIVSPSKPEDNDYYISNDTTTSIVNALIPLDSRWNYWDGESEPECELGKTLAVVECNKGKAKKIGVVLNPLVNNTYQYAIDPDSVTYTGYITNTVVDYNADSIYYRPHADGAPWLHYGDNIPATGYTQAQMLNISTFSISFERNVQIDMFTVKNNKVYKFAINVDPVVDFANTIFFDAHVYNNIISLVVDISEYESNRFYYQLMTVDDERQYYMYEPIDPSYYVEWDKTSTIPLESSDFTMIKLVIVDNNNDIIAVGKADLN